MDGLALTIGGAKAVVPLLQQPHVRVDGFVEQPAISVAVQVLVEDWHGAAAGARGEADGDTKRGFGHGPRDAHGYVAHAFSTGAAARAARCAAVLQA